MGVTNGAIAAVILPVSFLIGLEWGLIGVCYAWLIGYSAYFAIALIRSLPCLGVSFGAYFKTVAGIAVSSLVMLAVVHTTRTLLPPEWSGGFAALAVLIAAGAVAFGLLAMLFHRESLMFVLRLVRQ